VYFSANFGYSQQRTNALANWYWGANAIALVAVGLLSDRVRVRKPFMLVGAVGSIAATSVFAVLATHHSTGYYTFAWLFVAIGVLSGVAYAPWMAGFTETVEKHNPAATATGLAVWGWTLRIVVAASSAVLPLVVTSASPLVEHGEAVAEAQREAGPALAVVNAHTALFDQLGRFPAGQAPQDLMARAAQEVGPSGLALVQKAGPQLAVLKKYGPSVQKAAEDGPGQWQTWWWVTVGGQVVFVPFIFVMAGRWSPRRAKEDERRHQEAVEREVLALADDSD
jgi:MFS family permease